MSIHIKESHKGLLHKDLGVQQGKKLTERDLERAKHSSSAAERKRATFAENARHWHHAKGGHVHSDEAEDIKLIRKEVKPSALKKAKGGFCNY